MANKKAEILTMDGQVVSPITLATNVLLDNGRTAQDLLDSRDESMFSPTITTSSSISKVGQGDNVDFSENVIDGAYKSCVLKGKTLVNYNAEGNDRNEYVCMPSVEGSNLTVNGTVEGKVKSAILSGQTLVNLLETKKEKYTFNNQQNWVVEDGYLKCNGTSLWHTVTDKFNDMIKPSTKYLLRIEIVENTLDMILNFDGYATNLPQSSVFLAFGVNEVGVKSHIVTTAPELDSTKNGLFRLPINITNGGTLKIRFMAIEYQEGMEEWDIPYFEGMQSVKMPVLTTSNEDGTKTNILTVNEPIELRGIGDVKDELYLLTGEVVQKFTTKTYNGSENWALHAASSKLVNCLHFYVNENDIKMNGKAISPQIKTLNYSELKDDEYISIGGSQHLHYKVDKNKLTSQDVNGFKQWLSQNPFTVQYQLATESIKTVDLSDSVVYSYKDTTHYTCSSEEGSLLPTLAIEEGVKYKAIIKPSTKYSIVFNRTEVASGLTVDLGGVTANVVSVTTGKDIVQITTPPTLSHNYVIFKGLGNVIKDVQVIEGDVADDIEYFEGMVDVKNPIVINCNSPIIFGKGGRL